MQIEVRLASILTMAAMSGAFEESLAAQSYTLYFNRDAWVEAFNIKKASLPPGTVPGLGTEPFHEFLTGDISCNNGKGICRCGLANGKQFILSSATLTASGETYTGSELTMKQAACETPPYSEWDWQSSGGGQTSGASLWAYGSDGITFNARYGIAFELAAFTLQPDPVFPVDVRIDQHSAYGFSLIRNPDPKSRRRQFIGVIFNDNSGHLVSATAGSVGYISLDNVTFPGGPDVMKPDPDIPPPDDVNFCEYLRLKHVEVSFLECAAATLFLGGWIPLPIYNGKMDTDPPFTPTTTVFGAENNWRFLSIDEFPAGFQNPFKVSVGASVLGTFVPGQRLTFPAGGVGEFAISDVLPAASNPNPSSFPLGITMNQNDALVAFAVIGNLQFACADTLTSEFAITRSGFRLNNATHRFQQSVTVTRKSNLAATTGPLVLAVDSLSSNAALYNPAGTTSCALPAGSPYIVLNPGSSWAPGQSITVNLEFTNPANAGITYTPRILGNASNR